MDKQRKIQTQLIVARIYLTEKAKKSILSNVGVKDIAVWTDLPEGDIQAEIDVCEELEHTKLCYDIALQYVQKAYRDYRETKNIETWFFGMFQLYGMNYAFSKDEPDLKQWLEEGIPKLGNSLIIDISGLPEGTLTTTILRNAMEFFKHTLFTMLRQYQGTYDLEVLAYMLGVPYDSVLKATEI